MRKYLTIIRQRLDFKGFWRHEKDILSRFVCCIKFKLDQTARNNSGNFMRNIYEHNWNIKLSLHAVVDYPRVTFWLVNKLFLKLSFMRNVEIDKQADWKPLTTFRANGFWTFELKKVAGLSTTFMKCGFFFLTKTD